VLHEQDDHCVMYDNCEGLFGYTPCVYNGLALPLENIDLMDENTTIIKVLEKVCPELVGGK
ncbi:hypothetical protein NPIL_419271, partial [Nephila pilipes]